MLSTGWTMMIGFTLGTLIGLLAWKVGALTRSGAMAAALTGGMIFGLGGLAWAVLLLAFFISSSTLSASFRQRKSGLGEKFAKGSRRDWGQVLANGGLGALLAAGHALSPDRDWPWVAFAGAVAAVNADTWATELGVLSVAPPRLITTGRVVEQGTSGGVTLAGTLASLGGAGLIGGLALAFGWASHPPAFLLATLIAGLAGSSFDSLLGATVQGIYHCPVCEKETERHPAHTCGSTTRHQRGWRWLNNDLVNLAASIMGAGVALVTWNALRATL